MYFWNYCCFISCEEIFAFRTGVFFRLPLMQLLSVSLQAKMRTDSRTSKNMQSSPRIRWINKSFLDHKEEELKAEQLLGEAEERLLTGNLPRLPRFPRLGC